MRIYINSVTLQMFLPEDKLQKLHELLLWFKFSRKASKKDLEKLGGLLAHCSKVVCGGITFSCRVYDLLGKVKFPYYKVRLSRGLQEDIAWWEQFACRFNGKATILENSHPYKVYTPMPPTEDSERGTPQIGWLALSA